MSEGIHARPEDVTAHISNLWGCSFREIALDAGRDPGSSNLTAVRLVADMRMAEETRRLAQETRRLRIWTMVAAVGAVVAAGVAAVGLLLAADDPDAHPPDAEASVESAN